MIVDDEITVGKKVSFIIHKELLKYWNLNLEENRYMDINERNINPLHSISREEYYSGKISDFTQLANIALMKTVNCLYARSYTGKKNTKRTGSRHMSIPFGW